MKTSKNDGRFGRHGGFLTYLKISKPLESAFTSFIVPQYIMFRHFNVYDFGMSWHKVQKNTYMGAIMDANLGLWDTEKCFNSSLKTSLNCFY